MQGQKIPFHRAELVGRELEHVAASVASGHIGAGGPFGDRCARRLEELLGSRHVLLTKSCTHALEMMALLLDLQPEDEVILPSFAYVTTANAFALRGARVVFADVERESLNLDPASVRARITPRTKAIVALHYAGAACDLRALAALAAERGISLLEDNAHGLGSSLDGRALGSFGGLSGVSFHETKTITCGEGGALAVNDEALLARAEILLQKGTDRAQFLRGQVRSYSWHGLGSSFEMSELHAAFLWGQLERWDEILGRRVRQWQRYARELAGWARANDVRLPVVPEGSTSSGHIFALRLPSEALRERFLQELAAAGVQATFHYLPLHLSRMGRALGYGPGDCPVSEEAGARLARLPLSFGLSDEQQSRVLEVVHGFRV
jgi:dTDP-4-amino-4,6-dideoxygalactose transaminase